MQELYERYHRLLFTLAYQMTGSVSDAEDTVQDVFLKLADVHPDKLAEPKAYLCKMATNRCMDLLKSARRKREQYFGQWLPEPVRTGNDEPFEAVARQQMLSYAMLVLLEQLTPAERAAFVLREALDLDYAVIADLIERSEANCRKLVSRARGKVGGARREAETACSYELSQDWIHRFLSALKLENTKQLVSLLAEDVAVISDGGGKVTAAVQPIESRDRVVQFLFGLFRKASHSTETDAHIEIAELNGQPGLIYMVGTRIDTAVLMDTENHRIRNLFFMRNPDKIRHLAGR
ncbi:RNA polymerase sigma-70 factor [Paenibacillus puldeungensis]|uniref:RNA polymerase sigma-70 factor n=1 Tax=Paenibacillus puldeungensis TaxID=696536 RepID=A0ABW3RV40_9BACL